MKSVYLLPVFLLLSVNVSFAQAQETLQVFDAPQAIDYETPRYPTRAASRGQEGWVVVNYMVDTEGKVFEPTVVASGGSEQFEEAALKALQKSKFKPAQFEGKPVEGSAYTRYTFRLDNSNYATRSFVRKFEDVVAEIEEGEQNNAATMLSELEDNEVNTHYEAAYVNFAKALYAQKHGTPFEQMRQLQNALQHDIYDFKGDEFLPEALTYNARVQLFALEVENKYYGEALKTYALLKSVYQDKEFKSFDTAVEQIMNLKKDDKAYFVASQLDDNGFFTIDLFKRGFYVDNSSANISEYKLRCEKKYVFFGYEADKQYRVPESWGDCSLQILGDAKTEFDLVQF